MRTDPVRVVALAERVKLQAGSKNVHWR